MHTAFQAARCVAGPAGYDIYGMTYATYMGIRKLITFKHECTPIHVELVERIGRQLRQALHRKESPMVLMDTKGFDSVIDMFQKHFQNQNRCEHAAIAPHRVPHAMPRARQTQCCLS